MTSMQEPHHHKQPEETFVLYPPLEDSDTSTGSCASRSGNDNNNNRNMKNGHQHHLHNSDRPFVMSLQLQHNFQVLTTAAEQQQPPQHQPDTAQLATETAWLVQTEVARMKASIAELEQQLWCQQQQQQEEEESQDVDDADGSRSSSSSLLLDNDDDDDTIGSTEPKNRRRYPVFPILPPVVVPHEIQYRVAENDHQDDDHVSVSSSSSSSSYELQQQQQQQWTASCPPKHDM